MVRNAQMATYAAEREGTLLAFWDGKSRGTANMIQEAEKKKLRVFVCTYNLTAPEPQHSSLLLNKQTLTTKTELLHQLAASDDISDILVDNPLYWRYPIGVGPNDGAYVLAVEEGVLIIPFDYDDNKTEVIHLDRAYLSYRDGLEYMASELILDASAFQSYMRQAIDFFKIEDEPK